MKLLLSFPKQMSGAAREGQEARTVSSPARTSAATRMPSLEVAAAKVCIRPSWSSWLSLRQAATAMTLSPSSCTMLMQSVYSSSASPCPPHRSRSGPNGATLPAAQLGGVTLGGVSQRPRGFSVPTSCVEAEYSERACPSRPPWRGDSRPVLRERRRAHVTVGTVGCGGWTACCWRSSISSMRMRLRGASLGTPDACGAAGPGNMGRGGVRGAGQPASGEWAQEPQRGDGAPWLRAYIPRHLTGCAVRKRNELICKRSVGDLSAIELFHNTNSQQFRH